MKKNFSLLAVCIALDFFAQTANGQVSQPQTADVVELVNMEKMPLPLPPGEVTKMQGNTTMAADGFSSKENAPEMVKGFFDRLNIVNAYIARQSLANGLQNKGEIAGPEVHKDLSTLKLSFKARSFNRGKLIAAVASGTLISNTWTGVERFLRIDGVGNVHLSELDLGASGGKFYMMKEAVNTQVRGKPAISKVFTDDDGRTVEKIVWGEGRILYMLTFGADRAPDIKTKAIIQTSAYLLAHDLY
ncbi:MAG: hypothetical protein HYZ65_08190 [Burkholderiales bacterium]|nr:hypothetical protein [Burkholderiales bacterium]